MTGKNSRFGLDRQGMHHLGTVHWNQPAPVLYEHAVRRGEGELASGGSFSVSTGLFTGRTPRDKYIVEEPGTKETVDWGKINQPVSPEQIRQPTSAAARLPAGPRALRPGPLRRRRSSLPAAGAGGDRRRLAQPLFAQHVHPPAGRRAARVRAGFTILHAPNSSRSPSRTGINSEVFIFVNFAERLVLIGGTKYAGEIKKSVFGYLNFVLPARGVLPMHASANVGPKGDCAIFFGLSGTGKTTLSADARAP